MDGVRAHDRIATYSGRGPSRLDYVLKPDIIAPGNQVISTLADDSWLADWYVIRTRFPGAIIGCHLWRGSNKYFKLSGTSMARR